MPTDATGAQGRTPGPPRPATPLERPESGIWSQRAQDAIDARDLGAELHQPPATGAPVTSWRVRHAVIRAVQWTGGNIADVQALAGLKNFGLVDPESRAHSDDPECDAELFAGEHSTWTGVKPGQWIVKGVTGVLFTVADEKFREDYEPVPPAIPEPLATGRDRTPPEALAAELDGAADAFDKDVRRDGLDLDIGCRDTLRDAARAIRERLAPEWTELAAMRDMLAAELQGVHGELRACGVKGDPVNHWAPALVSMLARDRRAMAADVASLRDEYREARQALEYILRTSTDIGSRQDARRALAGEEQPWAREATT